MKRQGQSTVLCVFTNRTFIGEVALFSFSFSDKEQIYLVVLVDRTDGTHTLTHARMAVFINVTHFKV